MCLSVEMQGLLGLAVYIVCSTAPDPIPVVALCGLERENREIPTDAWYTDGSSCSNQSTWIMAAIQPNNDIIWMETETNHSS